MLPLHIHEYGLKLNEATTISSMQGVLDNAGFPAVVTAHFVPIEGQQRPRTTILIKFADEVSIPTYMIYPLP